MLNKLINKIQSLFDRKPTKKDIPIIIISLGFIVMGIYGIYLIWAQTVATVIAKIIVTLVALLIIGFGVFFYSKFPNR